MMLRLPSLVLLVALPFVSAAPAGAQSFDCRAAGQRDERTICQDPGLALLDQQLASLYRGGVGSLAEEQRERFQRHEVLFLNARRRCGENSHCIAVSYRNRIRELQALIATAETAGKRNAASLGDDESSTRQGERPRTQLPEKPAGAMPEPREASAPELRPDPSGSTMAPKDAAAEPPAPPKRSRHQAKSSPSSAAASAGGETAAPAPRTEAAAAPRGAKPSISWVDPPPAK